LGVLAVGVGGVGVYSLIAYIVSWRTREIGIRLALGASRWHVVAHGGEAESSIGNAGSVAGLIASIASTQVLRRFLFEVKPFDQSRLAQCFY